MATFHENLVQSFANFKNKHIVSLNTNTSWYGTCPTGASTAAKVATTTDSKFELVTGAKVRIKFTYTNTATTPTLNVDSKGAKTIYGYGTTKPNSWWKAGDTVEFIYDGNYWIMSPSQGQIYQINSNLTANNNNFIFAYDSTTQSYGYKAGGADSFHPFKSGTLEFIDDIVASGNASAGTKLLDIGSADYRYLFIKSNDSYAMVELVNGSTIPFGFGDMNYHFRCGEVNSINDHSCTIKYTNGYYVRSSSSGTWGASSSVFVPRAVYGLK